MNAAQVVAHGLRITQLERIELYTEAYARAHAAGAALRAGLQLNAGHDLNRDNLTDFLRAVPGVQEVSIGHALIADALELGLDATVRDYLRCIARAGQPADAAR